MKTQKGITLMALIITIIVMLILVGVSVSVALNTGLFKTAQGAARNTEEQKEKEQALSEGDLIDSIVARVQKVKCGDYVEYIPNGGTYKVNDASTGVNTSEGYQTFTTEGDDFTALKWRVLNINSNGSIDLILSAPVEKDLALDGIAGYNHGVDILNDLCSELYSNSSLGAKGRSLNVEDVIKKTTKNVTKAEVPISDGAMTVPQIYLELDYTGNVSSGKNNGQKTDGVWDYIFETESVESSSLEYTTFSTYGGSVQTATYRNIDLGKNTAPNKFFCFTKTTNENVSLPSSWLASRANGVPSVDVHHFYLWSVRRDGKIQGRSLYNGILEQNFSEMVDENGNSLVDTITRIWPVVTLPSNTIFNETETVIESGYATWTIQ